MFMLVTTSINAQIKPNSFVFGGKVSYNQYNSFYTHHDGSYDKISTFSYSISPELGWQFNDKFSAGIILNIVKDVKLDFIIEESYRYGASIFARYQTPIYQKLNVYFQPQIGAYYLGDEKYKSIASFVDMNKSDYNFIDASLNLGLLYSIHKRFSVELNIINFSYLSRSSIDENDESIYSKFAIGWDLLHPNIGVKLYL